MHPQPTGRVLVVVPAWNEQDALPAVLSEIAEHAPWADVLVVSDGSTDGTSGAARRAGVPVLDLPVNLGVGGAMRAGFKYAVRSGHEVVVQVDADGQHDPRDIGRLVARLDADAVDIVIGARFAGAGSYEARGPRRAAMRMFATVLSRITGTRLTDTTSGFKAMGPRAVALFAGDYPAEYLGDTIEALVIAARAGLTVAQEGVEMRTRQAGTPSHSPWKAAVFLVRASFALVMALLRPRPAGGTR